MSKIIDSIEKGYGDDSIYFKVGNSGVTKIEEGLKPVEFDGNGITKELLIYNVFVGDKIVSEIESNSGLCVSF